MPAGRPTSYDDSYPTKAAKLCALGATDQEIADFFDVQVRTIHRWKADHEEFSHALKVGKETADNRVERSLYQRAIGYEQDEIKIFMPAGRDEPVYAPYRAKIAPCTTAQIFWLKNRRRDLWRDRHEIGGDPENPLKVEDSGIAKLAAALDAIAGRTTGKPESE